MWERNLLGCSGRQDSEGHNINLTFHAIANFRAAHYSGYFLGLVSLSSARANIQLVYFSVLRRFIDHR